MLLNLGNRTKSWSWYYWIFAQYLKTYASDFCFIFILILLTFVSFLRIFLLCYILEYETSFIYSIYCSPFLKFTQSPQYLLHSNFMANWIFTRFLIILVTFFSNYTNSLLLYQKIRSSCQRLVRNTNIYQFEVDEIIGC